MTHQPAALSAADAYRALHASYDTLDCELSCRLMQRVASAPVLDSGDWDAKISLLAEMHDDERSCRDHELIAQLRISLRQILASVWTPQPARACA